MFEFLFRYPLSSYRQAEWFYASGWSLTALLLSIAVAAAFIAWSLFRQQPGRSGRTLLWTLQTLVVAGLLGLLWKPALRTEVLQPGDNTVSVMIDTSRSMNYIDADRSRLDKVRGSLQQLRLLDTLTTSFTVELNSVAGTVEPLALDNFPVAGNASRLGAALTGALDTAAERALAGVVLITDGADTDEQTQAWWQTLAGYQVPVYTVGVSSGPLAGDLALADVQIPTTATAGTDVSARVEVRYDAPGDARLRVFDGDALLAAADLKLPAGQSRVRAAVTFSAGDVGLRDLRFELVPAAGEKNLRNNVQRRVLQAREDKRRILYFEGEPRWEYKFIRRALHNSPAVDLVSLLRTSTNKFYRQGVKNAEELADGFPKDRETLFAYDAIVIGSVDAAMLSSAQQQNLREFVRLRGGSLLMLAGRAGLADGGWSRTVVAGALPVSFRSDPASFVRARASVSVTDLGLKTPWLQFAPDSLDNLRRWEELPELADLQLTGREKPGASVLLRATLDGERVPLLSWQRYGRGKSFVLATSGTWRWQMSLPADDQRHERFWQGLLGELVSGVLPRLALVTGAAVYRDKNAIDVSVDLHSADFTVAAEVPPVLSMTAPDNTVTAVSLSPDRDVPGRYRAVVEATLPGEYRLVASTGEGDQRIEKETWVVREDQSAEDHALYPDTAFLQRIARETGGEYLTLDQIGQVPELLAASQSVRVRKEILPLWNLPAVFLFLLSLKLLEYGLRWRWKRL